MIDRSTLAEAARDADAFSEEHGIERWAEQHNTDITGLHYIAEQRALRAAFLLIDGGDPAVLKRPVFQRLPLSDKAKAVFPVLMACIIDGYAIGRTARDSA